MGLLLRKSTERDEPGAERVHCDVVHFGVV
jgi:hypothetical protein